MFNVANAVSLFNQLVKEKYPDCKKDRPSDQLISVLQLLANSSEMIDGDITLDIDDYDDADQSYTIEPNDTEETFV